MLPLAAPARSMPACEVDVEDPDQAVRFGIRERPEHDAVDQREQDCADADADAHGHDRQQRHAGRTAQDPRGVARFARELLQSESRSAFGNLLPRGLDAANLEAHLPPRLGLADAGLHLPRHQHLDVMRELFRRLAIELAASD